MEAESVTRLQPVPITGFRAISVSEAASIANRSPDTISRWCQRYGIGRQLSRGTPWRISHPALLMVNAGDADALEAFRHADFGNPLVELYTAGLAE